MSHLQAGNDPVMMLNRSNCDGAVQPVEYNSRITRQFISHFSPAGMPPVSDANNLPKQQGRKGELQ